MTPRSIVRSVAAVALAAGFVVASIAPTAAAGHTTEMRGNTFTPADMTLAVGDSMSWHNFDAETHSVVGGPINSPDIAPNGDFSWTFSSPGQVSYTCRFHPYMNGIVNVTSAGAPSPAPTAAPSSPGVSSNPTPTTAKPSAPASTTPANVVPAARFAQAGAPLEPALVSTPTTSPAPTIAPPTAPSITSTTEPTREALQLASESSGSGALFVVAAVALAALVLLGFVGVRSARRPM